MEWNFQLIFVLKYLITFVHCISH